MERDFSTNYGTQNPAGQNRTGTQGDPLREQVRDTASQVKSTAREGLDEGRRAMNDVMDDVQQKGRQFAERARRWGNEAKDRSLRVARDIGGYAEDNTGVVAIAMLAVGILIGRYLVPTND